MTSTTPISQIGQLPNPDELVELLQIDCSVLSDANGLAGPVFHIAPYPMDIPSPGDIVFGGVVFIAIPLSVSGFLADSQGTQPQPKLTVTNLGGIFSAAIEQYNDLKGSIVTRTRTYKRYLDGGIEADSSIYMNPDVYLIDQKSSEDNTLIEFQLATAIDQQGVMLPGGLILKNTCTHLYRFANADGSFSYANATCPYVGTNYFTTAGIPTSDPRQDDCGRLTSDCILRFLSAALPTRAFPGVANNG